MEIYNPIAKRVGEDIVIEYYDNPEPDRTRYYFGRFKTSNDEFAKDYYQWKESKKTAVFHRGTEDEFKNELVYIWKNTRINKLFNETLTTVGISLESIKDRLALKVDCLENCSGLCGECSKMEKYFILKPEHKEELENDLWNEVDKILDDNTRTMGTKIAYIRTKFTIKRK